ncbi:MAG TPA: hypothetical protein VLM20_03190 [Methylophilaceae bacterium]|nr:hypothetical protein [Methylophilaceae bacterium]
MKTPYLTLFSFVSLLSLSSCYGPPPRAVGLYGPNPVKQSIPGSNAQAILSRTVEFNAEEVFEATTTAIKRLAYILEEQKPDIGKVTASGYFNCDAALTPAVTMAIYIKQVDPSPLTEFTVILDRHDYQCWLSGEKSAAREVAREIQKVLATY